jgi:hypothetical protein
MTLRGIIFAMTRVALTALFFVATLLADSGAPAQKELTAYSLPPAETADFSPNEDFVVVGTTVKVNWGVPHSSDETVFRLFDFKKNTLLGEQHIFGPRFEHRFVRYMPNRAAVLAVLGNEFYLMRVPDLQIERAIAMPAQMRTGELLQGAAFVTAIEISPDGKQVAVLRPLNILDGRIELYDIASGREVGQWTTPIGAPQLSKQLQWSSDGQSIYFAIAQGQPCNTSGHGADVFQLDLVNNVIKQWFATRMLTANIFVTGDKRVFAVDDGCVGMFNNHDPPMRVFDLTTGKVLALIRGRGTGVRYFVTGSRDESRVVAFTGIVKPSFDWGDMHTNTRAVDGTFSIWNTRDYSGVVTSQAIPALLSGEVRISNHGRFVVVAGTVVSVVYEVP